LHSSASLLFALDMLVPRWDNKELRPVCMVVFPTPLLVIGIPDQVPRGLMSGRKLVEAQYKQEGAFVQKIEAVVPWRSMIFQLPYFPFPEGPAVYNMTDYQEMKGYPNQLIDRFRCRLDHDPLSRRYR
jgi:hypothetical protein